MSEDTPETPEILDGRLRRLRLLDELRQDRRALLLISLPCHAVVVYIQILQPVQYYSDGLSSGT